MSTLPGSTWPSNNSKSPKSHAALFINLADVENLAMLHDADARRSQNLRHLLRFAQGVGQNDRHRSVLERLPHEGQKFFDHLVARRQPIGRRAVGAFDDENIGVRQFRPFGGGRLAEFEIARVKQRFVAVFGQKHRRAEAVAGGIGRQPQAAPLDRLPIRQMQRRSLAEPQLIERRRLGRAQGVFVPADMVAVRVRNERPGLAASKIDRQSRLGQFQTVVPVKKSFGFQSTSFSEPGFRLVSSSSSPRNQV